MSVRRSPLRRSVVVAAAIELADAQGIEAVSMRRLAAELGVVPMALYKHVADKDDLTEAMADAVIDRFGEYDAEPDAADGGWRAALRAGVLAARREVLAHPWARRVIETRTRRTPAVLRHMDTMTGHLLRGGLSADLAHHAMHTLGNRIWGFSPELFNDPAHAAVPTAPAVQPGDYPAIEAVVGAATARRPGLGCDEEFEFCFALDLILDAVDRLHRDGWASS